MSHPDPTHSHADSNAPVNAGAANVEPVHTDVANAEAVSGGPTPGDSPASIPPLPGLRVPVRVEPAPPERPVVMPAVDIFDSPEGLVLIADLPGASPESLDLQVQDNKLTLFGRLADPPSITSGALRHEEFELADYLRSFILSEEVDHERISARLANGVLELRLPRLPKTAPRKIPVLGD